MSALKISKSVHRSKLSRLKVLALLVSAMMLRPTALGSTYTSIGLVVAAFALGLIVLTKRHTYIRKTILLKILMGTVLFVYLMTQGVVTQSARLDFVFKSVTANLIVICTFGIALADKEINSMFFRMLIIVWALLGVSAVVTTVLSFFTDLESLYLGQITIRGYNDKLNPSSITSQLTGRIYFPLSLYYTYFRSANLTFHRFMGVFREPGIASAFLSWGIVYSLYRKLPRWVTAGLVCGIVVTFSTSGAALLVTTAVLWRIWRARTHTTSKILMTIMGGILAFLAFLYTPYVGAIDKSVTHGLSLEARIGGIRDGLTIALEKPLGVGFYNQPGNIRGGINLLAITGQIGVTGLFLALAVYLVPLLSRHTYRKIYMIAVLPILVTELLSQPLVDAPLVYVIVLFADFSKSGIELGCDRQSSSQQTIKTKQELRVSRI